MTYENVTALKFSDLLVQLRRRVKMKQSDLADVLDVSKGYIAQLETDKKDPSKPFIKSLAKALHIHSFSLMPLLSLDEVQNFEELSDIEQKVYKNGISVQSELIDSRSHYLEEAFRNLKLND